MSAPLFTHSWGRRSGFMLFPRAFTQSENKHPHSGFELGSPILFPSTITAMLSTLLNIGIYIYIYIYIYIERERERDFYANMKTLIYTRLNQ